MLHSVLMENGEDSDGLAVRLLQCTPFCRDLAISSPADNELSVCTAYTMQVFDVQHTASLDIMPCCKALRSPSFPQQPSFANHLKRPGHVAARHSMLLTAPHFVYWRRLADRQASRSDLGFIRIDDSYLERFLSDDVRQTVPFL